MGFLCGSLAPNVGSAVRHCALVALPVTSIELLQLPGTPFFKQRFAAGPLVRVDPAPQL